MPFCKKDYPNRSFQEKKNQLIHCLYDGLLRDAYTSINSVVNVHQPFMAPLFDYFAIIEHDDQVCIRNRLQPISIDHIDPIVRLFFFIRDLQSDCIETLPMGNEHTCPTLIE